MSTDKMGHSLKPDNRRPPEEGGHHGTNLSLDHRTRKVLARIPKTGRSEAIENAFLLRKNLYKYGLADLPMTFDGPVTFVKCLDTIIGVLRQSKYEAMGFAVPRDQIPPRKRVKKRL